MLNEKDRPAASAAANAEAVETFTANRGLQVEEPLSFEIGRADVTGVDLPAQEAWSAESATGKDQRAGSTEGATGKQKTRLGRHARKTPIGLPGLSEPEAVRHFVRLSQKNYAIDTGIYPLGSCTMKHNPRLNEKMARLPGFADIHPLQPLSTVPGAIALIAELGRWLLEMTGMQSVAMSPKAGAHGEACGMMAIKAALEAKGEKRSTVLVPESAHGTNPATAALIGFEVVDIPARDDGTVDAAAVRARLDDDVAGIMLTNPNTCGLYERDIVAIADAVHAAGGYFYADGANFNAVVGKVRPGDLGVDAMHINLHKTFSTPHGGGGPGAGPVVFSDNLAPYAPVPFVRLAGDRAEFVGTRAEAGDSATPFGRITAFHGQMGMFVRALAYMLSHGADGMRQASEDAVLNANYVRVGLRDLMGEPFGDRICMHEVLFDDGFLDGTGVTTLDFAKAMIDEGFHPMTMYFPLVVHGAMLIEPTESESKASLDLFVATLRELVLRAKRGEAGRFHQAPQLAPRRRLDETRAARAPKLKWEKPDPYSEAAE